MNLKSKIASIRNKYSELTQLSRKIAFSTLIQYGGKAIQLVLGAVSIKWISTNLDPIAYGTYGAIGEYALFFGVVANFGIFANLVRKMADQPPGSQAAAHTFSSAFWFRIISAIGVFGIALIILKLQNVDQIFFTSAAIFFAGLFFEFITTTCDGMLQANYLMGRATFALIIGRLLNIIGILLIVQNNHSMSFIPAVNALPALFAITTFGSFVTAILSLIFVLQKIKISFTLDRVLIKNTLITSLPFGIIIIINNLYFRFLPDYFSQKVLNDIQFSAFYSSFRIAQVVSIISTLLMFSTLPALKRLIDEKHLAAAAILYKKISWLLIAGAIGLVGIGSLFGPKIIEILTHKKYILGEFWFLLPLMLLLAGISYIYDLVLVTIFAFDQKSQDRWLVTREILALLISLPIFALSLITKNHQFQVIAIVTGALAGETTMVILGWKQAKRLLGQTN